MNNVAIVGLGPDSHGDAPVGESGWDVWGIMRDPHAPRYDRLFQLHDISTIDPSHIERVNDFGLPVWMQKDYPEVKYSVEYPLKAIARLTGDYFCSNIAYMIAAAIWEWRPKIDLYGVELSGDIYDHHRPNLEYLIGLARGLGTEVEIHGKTKLMQPDGMHERWEGGRYGWL
jgi:hypothetical protein